MFVEIPAFVGKDEDPYSYGINSERVMWFTPMQDGDEDFTRLFMNVADDDGNPAQIDVSMPYDEVLELFKSADHNKGEQRESND